MSDTSNIQADEVLYHYCGAESFLSIIKGRAVWLSGISLANDTMEGRIVAETLMRLADESALEIDQRAEMQNAIEMVGQIFEGLAFCLSKADDLLSQWRGYAADGAGYAIGFSRQYLAKLTESIGTGDYRPQFGEVLYEKKEHEQLAKPVFESLVQIAKADELSFGFRFGGLLTYPLPPLEQIQRDKKYKEASLALLLQAVKAVHALQFLKQSGFAEEKEVRLTAPVSSHDKKVEFRTRGQDLVPYLSLELAKIEGLSPIREVWIGPKNRTPTHLVEAALTRYEFTGVSVHRSKTTYR
jgi:hypothetical protein